MQTVNDHLWIFQMARKNKHDHMKKSSDTSFIVKIMATICLATMTNIIGFSQTNTHSIVVTFY